MKSRHLFIAALAALTIAGIAVFVADPFATKAPLRMLRPGDDRVVAQGERLYQARCASCHGARLEGQPDWRVRGANGLLPAPPHDASGHTWHHTDDLLFRITKFGVAQASGLTDYPSAMPAFEHVLSDAEIVAVLSWIKAQWPPSVRDHQDEVNAQQAQAAQQ